MTLIRGLTWKIKLLTLPPLSFVSTHSKRGVLTQCHLGLPCTLLNLTQSVSTHDATKIFSWSLLAPICQIALGFKPPSSPLGVSSPPRSQFCLAFGTWLGHCLPLLQTGPTVGFFYSFGIPKATLSSMGHWNSAYS